MVTSSQMRFAVEKKLQNDIMMYMKSIFDNHQEARNLQMWTFDCSGPRLILKVKKLGCCFYRQVVKLVL